MLDINFLQMQHSTEIVRMGLCTLVVLVTCFVCIKSQNVTLPNIRVVLVRQVNPGSEVIQDIPNSDVRLSFSTTLRDNETIRMECNASYPIHWIYEGDYGSPVLATEEFLHLVKLDPTDISSSTFLYQETVVFKSLREGNTGKYTCVGIHDTEQEVYFNLYVMGSSSFLYPKERIVVLFEGSTFAYIPCIITDNYLLQVSLLKGVDSEELTLDQAVYEPYKGFKLNLTVIDEPYDNYKCVATSKFNTSMVSDIQFSLVRPIGITKALPVENYVPHKPENETSATFICQSKLELAVKIIINENTTLPIPIGVKVTLSEHPNDPDGLIYMGRIDVPTADISGNLVEIQCINKDDERIFHTWEYSPYGVNHIDHFGYIYNETSDEYDFSCCTYSFHTPILRWSPCSSASSCGIIRRKTLSSMLPEDVVINTNVTTGRTCVIWSLKPTNYEFGLLQCSLQFNYPATDMNHTREILYSNSELEPHNLFLVDDQFLLPPIDQVLKIQKLSESDIIGTDNEFICTANSLFFSRGLQWGIQFKNETTQMISEDQVIGMEFWNSTVNFRQSRFALHSLEINAVICMAPLSKFTNWKSIQTAIGCAAPQMETLLCQWIPLIIISILCSNRY